LAHFTHTPSRPRATASPDHIPSPAALRLPPLQEDQTWAYHIAPPRAIIAGILVSKDLSTDPLQRSGCDEYLAHLQNGSACCGISTALAAKQLSRLPLIPPPPHHRQRNAHVGWRLMLSQHTKGVVS
jgi:hypothetical protein